MLISQIELTVK